MHDHFPVADRETLEQATELLACYGDYAASEAAIRADRSRALGNVLHFCHWRQVERVIEMLRFPAAPGTIH